MNRGASQCIAHSICTGEHLITEETVEHIQGLVAQHGTDCWWTLPIEELLHPKFRNNGKLTNYSFNSVSSE
jgi:isoleucyl-tRNA synthetase